MASEPTTIRQLIRFGRDFEFDPELCELRRAGRVLRLERIPLAILLLLLQKHGRVVGRQEIADAVWGKGISLDIDNSINGGIRKIRRVLRDNPEQPRFIQTVTGRGYRFIAPITCEPVIGRPTLSPGGGLEANGSEEKPRPRPSATDEARELTLVAATVTRRWRFWQILLVFVLTGILATGGAWVWRRDRAHTRITSAVRLAVLPFQNLTGDPSQDYYSDGFTEEMITQLGNLDPQQLAVIARTSVMVYKDSHVPLARIAQDLHVQYVLEGSIRRDEQHVLITAQLIQVQDQTHLWAREYDRPREDLLEIQKQIAREIAGEIRLTLVARGQASREMPSALSPEQAQAWDFYLRGRYSWNKRTLEGLQEAVDWFSRAAAVDPKFARAYAGLADSWTLMSSYGFVPAGVYMPRAKVAALRALQLDDSLAEAHTSLALIAENFDWDWRTAEREYRRALQLNSNYATAHHWFAECLAYQGRFDEAMQESERARQLDPLSLIITTDSGAILYYARDYDRAVTRLQGVLDADPNSARAHLIVQVYAQQGRYQEALDHLRNWQRLDDGPWVLAFQAYIYGRSGNLSRARAALRKLQLDGRTTHLDSTPLFSLAYAGVGDKKKWIATLQQACRQHSNLPTTFKVDPLFDSLRGDQRFQALVREAGLDH